MFQRTLILRPAAQAPDDVYRQASALLRDAIAVILPEAAPALAEWPHVTWSSGQDVVCGNEWTAESDVLARLLTVELQVVKTGQIWHLRLQIGATTSSEAVVQQECSLNPAPAMFPLHALPDLLSFAEHFACYDVDGMRTGVAYTVQKGRAAELRTFLQRPRNERRLPLVLVTRAHSRAYPLDYHRLARILCGVAHVMCLDPKSDWKKDDISTAHPCTGSAVRLYRPGYVARDAAKVHPCYTPVDGQINSQDKLELLDKCLAAALAADRDEPLIGQLAGRQQAEQADRQMQQRLAERRQRWAEEATREQDELWRDLVSDHERVVAELDRVKHERDAAHDEIRRLRYELQQERAPRAAPAPANSTGQPYVTLSRRADDVLNALDPSEKDQVTALLHKLATEDLRDNQSEVCHAADTGSFYVFPRKKTNGGRRVIYLLQQLEVRVCEIYVKHDDYERARNKGWNELDYQEARLWSDSGKVTEQIPMALLH